MRVGAVAAAPAHEVEARRTPVSTEELKGALERAWTRATGAAPTAGTMKALLAQASLETGRGGAMYNFNFGGIKGHAPSGGTAHMKTKEVEDGKTVTIVDGFRAYESLDEGADDYVRLMRGQFGKALAAADGGLDAFAHELKSAHYYTANETDYAAALHALAGEPAAARPGAPAPAVEADRERTPADRFRTAQEVMRMFDAISVSMTRLAREPEEDP